MKRVFLFISIALCLLSLLLPALARAQTASVGGVIRDPSEKVVSGAKVSLLNSQTGISRDVSTNDDGLFWFTNVAPGPYSITVERDGFKVIHIDDLSLTVNQSFTFEAHLELGPVATTTEVKASELPPIDLDNAQISNLVDSKRIQELPLLTRDPYILVLLSPGVIQSNNPGLNGFSVNGASQRDNNFLLDGVDNNDTDVPGAPKGLNALNPDSTQEFRVITSNFAPEYGRNDGSIVQILTRSGTNDYHGDAYWFGRYDALGARDFFNPASTGPKNPYTRNDFGGSMGGPIIKDKAFWFLNYEGQRFITTLTNVSTVPTPQLKTGVFTAPDPTTGAPITVNVSTPSSPDNVLGLPLDPTMQKILSYFPAPNGPAVVPGISGTLFYPSTSRLQSDSGTAKVDYNINKQNTLSVRYTINQQSDPNFDHMDFLPNSLGATSLYLRNQNAAIGLTTTLSDTLVNEFRFGANRSHQDYACVGSKLFDSLGQIDSVGTGADYGIPFGQQNGYEGFGCINLSDADAQARYTGTYQTVDYVTRSLGRHLFKWGAEFRDIYSNSYDNFGTRTFLDFQGYTNSQIIALPATSPLVNDTTTENAVLSLLGYVDYQSQTQYFNKNQERSSTDLRGFRQREWAGFAQDTWKLLPNLTATYGLRYEYFGVPFEVNNNLSNLFADPSGPGPFTFSIVGPGTSHTLYNNQYNNFEPRLGLAWDPFKKGRTSVRAGYGIFHDRAYGNLMENTRGNPPFSLTAFNTPDLALSGVTPPAAITPNDPAFVPNGSFEYVTLIDPNLKTPYSQNWNFGVQHAITPTLTLEVNYVGVKGTHIFRVVDGNPPQPNLIAKLLADCTPGNAFGCSTSTLQFSTLWNGGDNGTLPFNAVNNNAFYAGGGPGAFVYKSIGDSIYNGLQVNLQKQFSRGFQFQFAYTYSHAIDNVNDPLVPAVGNGNLPRNSFDLQAERGNSDFDIRHRAVINFIYEPNIGRGRGHLNDGIAGRALEGWSVSGIISAQTGHPYDIFGLTDADHTGEYARVSRTGSTAQPPGTDKTYTGPSAASILTTPFDVQPNTGKNFFYGPGFANVDIAAIKDTALTEKLKLQFRTEVYNLFNHAQFAQPYNFFIPGDTTFGESLSTIIRPDSSTSARQIQFALKLIF
jgi:Carboxypeptidase regulatory-like domain/TonB dependent receptor/TonB-dependent Receptor Plug Domain